MTNVTEREKKFLKFFLLTENCLADTHLSRILEVTHYLLCQILQYLSKQGKKGLTECKINILGELWIVLVWK